MTEITVSTGFVPEVMRNIIFWRDYLLQSISATWVCGGELREHNALRGSCFWASGTLKPPIEWIHVWKCHWSHGGEIPRATTLSSFASNLVRPQATFMGLFKRTSVMILSPIPVGQVAQYIKRRNRECYLWSLFPLQHFVVTTLFKLLDSDWRMSVSLLADIFPIRQIMTVDLQVWRVCANSFQKFSPTFRKTIEWLRRICAVVWKRL